MEGDRVMPDSSEVKQNERQFYDEIGWQVEGDGYYQNARYEDLRPVAHEYIHRCHLRVGRHIRPSGHMLLDAGSGPVQYAEYLTYSKNYTYRVCADISIVALQEARTRLGEKGLYVVADVAHLPFKSETFDGVVSLHTLHHLPPEDHKPAYDELYRVLTPGSSAAIVNGWTDSPLMRAAGWMMSLMESVQGLAARLRGRKAPAKKAAAAAKPTGTYIHKFDPAWLEKTLGGRMDYDVRVWRSVNVRFLRAMIHPWLGGKYWLRLLYWLEERFPRFFGEKGQYPLIILRRGSNDSQ